MQFSDQLLDWYQKNRRDLPWRQSKDPYKIWLSEILLQQTRVEQGLPYYYRFIEAFPTLNKLAKASEDEVLRLWQGLGYYSRGRNLLTAARQMVKSYKGFPTGYKEIRSLKGIGDYTAAAIASIAFGLPYAVVDGNVYRFLSRYFGIDTPIDSKEGKKTFRDLADSLLDKKNPGRFNEAIMEMGALVCKPKPVCDQCVFVQGCYARQKNLISMLPVKSKKTAVRNRYLYYVIVHYKNKIFIRQRKDKDIWQGLFEFPLIECSGPVTIKKLIQSKAWKQIFEKDSFELIKSSDTIRHQLTHQTLHAVFIHIEMKEVNSPFLKKECKKVDTSELTEFAMPQLIVRYIDQHSGSSNKDYNSLKSLPDSYFINFAMIQVSHQSI